MLRIHAHLQKFAYFSAAFRTMFFLCALAGFFLPNFFASFILNHLNYPGVFKSIFNWHSHEMFFGFSLALVSGFLLTASINWSGNKMRNGLWLFALALFWVGERIAMMAHLPEALAIFLNFPFMILFIIMAGLQLKGNRNFQIIMPVLFGFFLAKEMLFFGDLYQHKSMTWAGRDLSLGLIRYLLALFACRLIPFFSSKRFPKIGTIQIPPMLRGTFLTSLLLSDALKAFFHFSPFILDMLLLVALIIGLWIWKLMRPLQTIKEPMIFILNVGFLWLLSSCVGEMMAHHLQWFGTTNVHIHILTTGALGCFSLGLMTRVSLAHSGHMMKANNTIIALFILVNIGALMRVVIPVMANQYFSPLLYLIASLWAGAYFLYLVSFTKILWTPQQGFLK
ncbi:MAG: NnrS family protein [Bdellovibrio sp.]|nr:NnrS family protein [Bdellovibrio sp.]